MALAILDRNISSFLVLGSLLFLCKSQWLIGILAGLCLYCSIHHQLRLAVGVAEEHGLETQDAFHCSMRKHPSKAYCLHSPFRKVGIVKVGTTGGALRVTLRLIIPMSWRLMT